MAKFAIKALVVTALVCLVFDCGRAADTQQQGLDSIQEAAKGKMTEFMNSFKQTASETFNKVQDAVKESENTKKVESQLSSFFSGALSKLKSTFSSTKTTNPDDLTKQEAIKAFDDYALAASDNSHQHQQNEDLHQQTIGHDEKDTTAETTPTPSTFKDKVKGFVSSVKEGASEALDKLDDKRKEAVAGTKKFVNGAIDKIKHTYDSYKNGNSEENVPRIPESSEEHVKNVADNAKDAKDAVIDKTQNFMKSEKFN